MGFTELLDAALHVDGVDLSEKVQSVFVDSERKKILIQLKDGFQSDNGTAHRHLKGLQKAKD